jgi:hypothetical protein
MTLQELQDLIGATMSRGDPRWVTPSGAILDILRDFARQSRLEEIAEGLVLYCDAHPGALTFIAGCIPTLLINNYPAVRDVVSFDVFLRWSRDNPEWADNLSGRLSDPKRFAAQVEAIVQSLQAYRDDRGGLAKF